MTNPLEKYFKENEDRIIQKWMHYFEIYHKHFERFRNKECVVLEIGISMGGSLQMWKHYFGNKVKIYGVDIDPDCKQFEDESIEIFIGSQADREFLGKIKEQIPRIDILIDDGGHRMNEQIITFEELYDHIKEDGVYLCEDIHTSYWDVYDGGYKKEGSFVEYAKDLIDHLNAWHIRTEELSPSKITRTAHSFHFYDSVFVIEKRKRKKPWDEMRGSYPHNIDVEIDKRKFQLFLMKLKLLGIELPKNLIPEFIYLKPFAIKSLYLEKYNGKMWPEDGNTKMGFKKLSNLEVCIREIFENDIKGDLVETGVKRGETSIFMRAMLHEYNEKEKKVWVINSFEGLPKPNEELYSEDKGLDLLEESKMKVDLETVKNKFNKFDLLDNRVEFLDGWFEDILPTVPISKISVLRLGGDLYNSTIQALYYLYPKLSIGGYCIIDDWAVVPGCKQAVQDFRSVYRIKDEIVENDCNGVYWKKTKEIKSMPYDTFMKNVRNPDPGFMKWVMRKLFRRF